MLSNPNVSEVMPKVGNRYETALAIAKRARNIEKIRIENESNDITDAVDIAAKEIAEEKVYTKINGQYVVEPKLENEDLPEKSEDDNDIVE